ncbi:hypothetical protein SMACR_07788 [Sordaria macrospora]|uniref:WGS project CABT00000000 data, contig 2.41 n=2 Tax=Sordaria macrospora TaxID=5147 RepID=F7W7W3_SORMK|nr:uncharacterized protein SMAC_07788 [Sordaria macrospora k-hell]KAA8629912.1 hypothetical protein SMACR_07788 [Sordaria macrospora]CCC13606.1 unnamed protein product [Sordaria macrospora k-hell]
MSDNRRRNGALGTWVPLVVTAAVATVSVAAWIWSQRKDQSEEHETNSTLQDLDYENADYGDNPAYGATGEGRLKPPARSPNAQAQQQAEGGGGWGLRRTPSPADFFNTAKRQVAAGVTAAGAAVENATTSSRNDTPVVQPTTVTAPVTASATTTTATTATSNKNQRRKKVAIIVSADNHVEAGDEEYHEHASILSHIPRNIDLSLTKLYILIYAPQLKDNKSEDSSKPASLSSSFSNIEAETPAETPAESKDKDPLANSAYTSLYNQATTLVSKPSHILTFSTPAGHSHILRHIQPEIIYLQESLAGPDGSVITSLQTWLRHDIVLVVGAEQGDGGLADSDSEDDDTEKNGEKEKKKDEEVKWWQKEERVGRGRGVVVVDVRAGKLGDDWVRRVQGRE